MKLYFGAIAGVDKFLNSNSFRALTITTSCYYWFSTFGQFEYQSRDIVEGYIEQNPLRHVLYDIEMNYYSDSPGSDQKITICPLGHQLESSRDDLQMDAIFPFFCLDALDSIFGNKKYGFDFWSHNITSKMSRHGVIDNDIVYIGGCTFEDTVESLLTSNLKEVRQFGALINERDQALDKPDIENGQRARTNGSIYV